MKSLTLPCLAFATLLCPSLVAQDLLGVSWSGGTYLIDSYTGAVTPLGSGLVGQNALARDNTGTFWSTSGTISTGVYSLTVIDPVTGSATIIFPGADLRGFTAGPGATLYATQDMGSSDTLVTIDLATGTITPIGATGFSSIQGLAMHQGVLYAWDINQGLLIVDASTGAATRPYPAAIFPSGQQGLCSHPDGRLLLGRDDLYAVDVTTGNTALIGNMGNHDLRGIDALSGGAIIPFGQGCDGISGPVTLTVSGAPQVGNTLVTSSNNHDPSGLGAMCFGINTSTYMGYGLPYLLDPMFGTVGCRLYISLDAVIFAVPTAPDLFVYDIPLTAPAAGAEVHIQHGFLEPVPGGMSWSNGVTIRVQ